LTLVKVLVLTLLVMAAAPGKDVFDLKVARVRTLRNQPGDLHIDAQAVTFRSADGKTVITIAMQDLREADVADSHSLRFQTYDVPKWKPMERRGYTFRAQPDAPVEELAQFLTAHVHHPVVGHYPQNAQFRVAAYHSRALGGTTGILEIGEAAIRFVIDKPADSRTWLYRDIETDGRPGAVRFPRPTQRENYVIELKC